MPPQRATSSFAKWLRTHSVTTATHSTSDRSIRRLSRRRFIGGPGGIVPWLWGLMTRGLAHVRVSYVAGRRTIRRPRGRAGGLLRTETLEMQKTRLLLVCVPLAPIAARAADLGAAVPTPPPVEFQQETLGNGLRVIYAPLHQAPVVHVRVLYHVGSRDERPDRQGFAHMFEHMMFRGSAHVAPEQHMKLIMQMGGDCNAFTTYDETVYFDT